MFISSLCMIKQDKSTQHTKTPYLHIKSYHFVFVRPGHSCPYTLTIASILMYEAIPLELADLSYKALRKVSVDKLGRYLPNIFL